MQPGHLHSQAGAYSQGKILSIGINRGRSIPVSIMSVMDALCQSKYREKQSSLSCHLTCVHCEALLINKLNNL